jgi:hypothetical protein
MTPLGILPPSTEKRLGSFRNSIISCSSSLASSTPATSAKVTLGWLEFERRARDFPKARAPEPEPCIWRIELKSQKKMMSGRPYQSRPPRMVPHEDSSGFVLISTPEAVRISYIFGSSGAYTTNSFFAAFAAAMDAGVSLDAAAALLAGSGAACFSSSFRTPLMVLTAEGEPCPNEMATFATLPALA